MRLRPYQQDLINRTRAELAEGRATSRRPVKRGSGPKPEANHTNKGGGTMTRQDRRRLVNLTPHAINILVDEAVIDVPPSGQVARLAVRREEVGSVATETHRVPVHAVRFGPVEGLPAAQAGVVLIASALVAAEARRQGRTDVLAPGELLRDEKGRVVGCRGLSMP